MGSVRFRLDTKRLYFDFLYRGVRCREYAALPDTPSNRRQMEKVLARIEAEISSGTFDYARTFPGSKKAQEFADAAPSAKHAVPRRQIGHLPKFREFSEQWFTEHSLEWRHTHKLAVESIFKTHLMPAFGELHLDQIDRARVMDFRRKLADPEQKQGRRRGPRLIVRHLITRPFRHVIEDKVHGHTSLASNGRRPDPLAQLDFAARARRRSLKPDPSSAAPAQRGLARSPLRPVQAAQPVSGLR